MEELTQNPSIRENRNLTLNADISVSDKARVTHNISSETPLNAVSKTVNIFAAATTCPLFTLLGWRDWITFPHYLSTKQCWRRQI